MRMDSLTEITPGRPTVLEHRHPHDEVRGHFETHSVDPLSRMHVMTIVAGEQQTMNFYMNHGTDWIEPIARGLYAEIASIEEQHVTQYESIIDPEESWLEKWLLHELTEVYNYYGCMQQEANPRIRSLWERFLDYELGHFHKVMALYKKHEKRDPMEILPESLPEPIPIESHREFVRETLAGEVDLRANGADIVPKSKESAESRKYREQMNSEGSPSETVSAGYKWAPGSELKLKAA